MSQGRLDEEQGKTQFYRQVSVSKIPGGGMFGEVALLDISKSTKRNARITCAENCAFATLHRD